MMIYTSGTGKSVNAGWNAENQKLEIKIQREIGLARQYSCTLIIYYYRVISWIAAGIHDKMRSLQYVEF